MKRFTDTDKWNKPWFRQASPKLKCLWSYLCDNCDAAGIIDLDYDLVSFYIGDQITERDIVSFGTRVQKLPDGKWILADFIGFQYGKLSRECKPHGPVFSALKKAQIDPDSIGQSEVFKNGISEEVRRKVIERDGCACVYTGKALMPWEIEIDHIIPRSRGGTNDLSNLVVMDRALNQAKSDLELAEFCSKSGLDYEVIRQRLSKAIFGQCDSSQRVSNTLQEKEKDKEKDKDKDACEVLRILNEASGVRFREVDSNLSIISARLNEPDVTIEGVRQMILRQCKLWKGTPQAEYLRPETLFRKSKFDAYYAMRDQAVNQDNGRNGSCGPSRNAGTLNDPSKYSAENLRKLPNYHGADKVPDANPNAPRLL